MIGFMSNVMAQASASYMRIGVVLDAPAPTARGGTIVADLRGDIALSHVVVTLGEKDVLKDVSLSVKAGTQDRGHRPDRRRQDPAAVSC